MYRHYTMVELILYYTQRIFIYEILFNVLKTDNLNQAGLYISEIFCFPFFGWKLIWNQLKRITTFYRVDVQPLNKKKEDRQHAAHSFVIVLLHFYPSSFFIFFLKKKREKNESTNKYTRGYAVYVR